MKKAKENEAKIQKAKAKRSGAKKVKQIQTKVIKKQKEAKIYPPPKCHISKPKKNLKSAYPSTKLSIKNKTPRSYKYSEQLRYMGVKE